MPDFGSEIKATQAKIESLSTKAGAETLKNYSDVFNGKVQEFEKLKASLTFQTEEGRAEAAKEEQDIYLKLLDIAARGEWLTKNPGITEVPKDFLPSANTAENAQQEKNPQISQVPTKPSAEKSANSPGNPIKPKETSDIPTLAQGLRSTLEQYKANLSTIRQLEGVLAEATQAKAIYEKSDDPELKLSPEKKLKALNDALIAYAQAQRIFTDSPNLPSAIQQKYKTEVETNMKEVKTEKYRVEMGIMVLAQFKEYVVVQNGIPVFTGKFFALPPKERFETKKKFENAAEMIKLQIEEIIQEAAPPQQLENYYNGKLLFETANLEGAKLLLQKFQQQNSEAWELLQKDPAKAREKYGASLVDCLSYSQKIMDKIEEINKNHQKFFEAQKMAISNDIVGAKKKLKEYVAEEESKKDKKEGDISFVGTAKVMLKKIALIQLQEVKTKFSSVSVPSETIESYSAPDREGNSRVTVEPNPAYAHYQKYVQAIEKAEGLITSGKCLDFSDAYEEIKKEGFDPEDEMNFLSDEVKLDQGKTGLLELARKYRKNGKYELAEKCFRQYFGDRLGKLEKKEVTIEELRKKYENDPKFQATITEKVHEAKKQYEDHLTQTNPGEAGSHPWTPEMEQTVRSNLEGQALSAIQPQEAAKLQQKLYSTDPASLGEDQGVWEEFSNMIGIHRQGTALEMIGMSDAEWEQLKKEIVVDIAIGLISGGLGGYAGQVVTRAILRAGVNAAGREVMAMGVSSGMRQAVAMGAGMLVENTVATGSSMVMNAFVKNDFSHMNFESFREEWIQGLKAQAALGMSGAAAHAFGIGAISSFGVEMGTMALLNNGSLSAHDIALVLGLKAGNAAGGKVNDFVESKKEPGKKVENPEPAHSKGKLDEKLRDEKENTSKPNEEVTSKEKENPSTIKEEEKQGEPMKEKDEATNKQEKAENTPEAAAKDTPTNNEKDSSLTKKTEDKEKASASQEKAKESPSEKLLPKEINEKIDHPEFAEKPGIKGLEGKGIKLEHIKEKLAKLTPEEQAIFIDNADIPNSDVLQAILNGKGETLKDSSTGKEVKFYKASGKLAEGGMGGIYEVYYLEIKDTSKSLPKGPKLENGVAKVPHPQTIEKQSQKIRDWEEAGTRRAQEIKDQSNLLPPLYHDNNGVQIMPKVESVYADGAVSLNNVMPKDTPSGGVGLMIGYAMGVNALNNAGVVNFDLKPANVFYGIVNGEPRVVIGDLSVMPASFLKDTTVENQTFKSNNNLQITDVGLIFHPSLDKSIPGTPTHLKFTGPEVKNIRQYMKDQGISELSPENPVASIPNNISLGIDMWRFHDNFDTWAQANEGHLDKSEVASIKKELADTARGLYDPAQPYFIKEEGKTVLNPNRHPITSLDAALKLMELSDKMKALEEKAGKLPMPNMPYRQPTTISIYTPIPQ